VQQLEKKQPMQISLLSLILQLWQQKLLILIFTSVFVAGGVFFSLSIPNKYQASVMLIPSEEGQGGGLSALASQFGGLAGMAGINLSGRSVKKTKIALQLLKSRSFLIDFINRNELQVLIFAGQEWDAKTNEVIINEKLYDINTKQWVRKFKFPKTQAPSEQEVYEKFVKMTDLPKDVLLNYAKGLASNQTKN